MEGSGKKLLVGIEHIGRCLTGRLAPSELYQQCISIICSHNSRSYHHSISFEHIVLYIGRCCPSIIAVSDSDSPPLMRSALGNPALPTLPDKLLRNGRLFAENPNCLKFGTFTISRQGLPNSVLPPLIQHLASSSSMLRPHTWQTLIMFKLDSGTSLINF